MSNNNNTLEYAIFDLSTRKYAIDFEGEDLTFDDVEEARRCCYIFNYSKQTDEYLVVIYDRKDVTE